MLTCLTGQIFVRYPQGLSFGKAVIKYSTVFARAGEGLHHHIQVNITYTLMLGVNNHLQDCFLAFN